MKTKRFFLLRFEFFKAVYHVLAMALIGLAAFPAVALLYAVWQVLTTAPLAVRLFVFALTLGPAYFLFGMSLLVICVGAKGLFGLRIRPGYYRIFEDWEVIRWMGCNLFILVVNALFLDAFRVSPFQNFFYRAMGARIGRGAQINTCGLADLALIEIGENAIIGGGVTLIGHSAERGMLRLGPVKIGRNVSVGLDTIILPDVEIGDGASIAPRSFLPAGSRVPPGARFGGHPARDLREERNGSRASGRAEEEQNTRA